MSKKYNKNIDHCQEDNNFMEESASTNITSKRAHKDNVDNLVVDIFEIIKDCQQEMIIPLFDEEDFGYFYIYEYLRIIGIQ